MNAEKPRQIAAHLLKRHADGEGFLDALLDEALDVRPLSSVDRALTQELVFGVVRWQATLDWLIARKTEGRQQKPMLQFVLRLGLYQLFWLGRIPDHAAVNETVELTKELGFNSQAGFVNAVLRAYTRERDATKALLAELKATQPALGHSHPEWLCERWRQRWGEDRLRQLLEWNNTPPVTFARLNALRTDARALAEQWQKEGVQFLPRQWDWTGDLMFELQSHPPLATLQSLRDGWFYIQDPSTLLAAREMAPQPGESVLDMCAAPGGKTAFMGQLMQNQGYIMAQDLDVRRRELVRENCVRLGVNIVNVSRATTTINLDLSEPFDRVLVDTPCSNTGVMRRRVELRWRLHVSEFERLRGVQFDLLHRGALQTRPGGALVYSTCSLEPEENSELLEQFLGSHANFRLEHERTVLPFIEGVDGAYVARLIRAA